MADQPENTAAGAPAKENTAAGAPMKQQQSNGGNTNSSSTDHSIDDEDENDGSTSSSIEDETTSATTTSTSTDDGQTPQLTPPAAAVIDGSDSISSSSSSPLFVANEKEEDDPNAAPSKTTQDGVKTVVTLDYHLFDDGGQVDLTQMTQPTLGFYQALSCQTDLWLTTILGERLSKLIRLSLHMIKWDYDLQGRPDKPLTITFHVVAFQQDFSGQEQPVDPIEIVKAIDNARYVEYIKGYVWNTYPIGGSETELLRQVNSVGYDVTGNEYNTASTDILYDTTVCPSLSLVSTTWRIGFYQQDSSSSSSLTAEAATPKDFIDLACQMYNFVATKLIHKYFGAQVDTTLQSVYWQFYEPDSRGYALDVAVDMKAILNHPSVTSGRGRTSPVPSAVINKILETSNLNAFVTDYLHEHTTYWKSVQKLKIESTYRDIIVGEQLNWRSDGQDGCPQVTAPPPVVVAAEDLSTSTTEVASVGRDTTFAPISEPQVPATVDQEQLSPAQTKPPQDSPSTSNTGTTNTSPAAPGGGSPSSAFDQPMPDTSGGGGGGGGSSSSSSSGFDQPKPDTTNDANFMEWCRRALFQADQDEDKHLNSMEYVLFLNLVGNSAYEGYPFVALPMELKNNFENWASEDANYQIELEAMAAAATTSRQHHSDSSSTTNTHPSVNRADQVNVGDGEGGPQERRRRQLKQDSNLLGQQQAHRDAICQGTNAALQLAAATEHPTPVRLRITTSFLAYNQEGIDTKQQFWDNSDDIAPAFSQFLTDYVADRMNSILRGGRKGRQLLRRQLVGTQYWVMPSSANIYFVREGDCPQDELLIPEDASCVKPSVKFEVFALTPTPDDPTDTDTLKAAAERATNEGIDKGKFQAALDQYNPKSIWTIQATSDTPAPAPVARPLPSPATVQQQQDGGGMEVVYTDDPNLDGVVVRTNGTMHVTDVQCGGEVGMTALNATGIDCDSFAGRHIWHIIVIVGLAVFLCLVFLPLLIWGRYPCCGSNQPKTMASLVGNRQTNKKLGNSSRIDDRIRFTDRSTTAGSNRTLDTFDDLGLNRSTPRRTLSKDRIHGVGMPTRQTPRRAKSDDLGMNRSTPRRTLSEDRIHGVGMPTRQTPRRTKSRDRYTGPGGAAAAPLRRTQTSTAAPPRRTQTTAAPLRRTHTNASPGRSRAIPPGRSIDPAPFRRTGTWG